MVTVAQLEEFVKLYQSAESVDEVCKAMNWKREKVASQASQLRKKGVPLRKFSRDKLSDGDIAKLAKLCGSK